MTTQYTTRNRKQYQSYHERLLDLLGRRSYALHKASSIRHNLPDKERTAQRVYHTDYAAHVKEKIIDLVQGKFTDNRPAPLPEFDYQGKRMVIQRYDGVTCWYVTDTTFKPELYEHLTLDYRTHIALQLARH